MDWKGVGMGLVWLLVGSAVRVLYPYLVAGVNAIRDGERWPPWEWKYLGMVGSFFLGYVGVLLISEPAREALAGMDPWAVFGIGYGGGDIIREAFRLLVPKAR
jgi:hypothetical protein